MTVDGTRKPIPKSCQVCVYLMTSSRHDERGSEKMECFCNYGQLRMLEHPGRIPDWCPNGGLPNTGGD